MIQVLDKHLCHCRNNEPAEHNGIQRVFDPSIPHQNVFIPDEQSLFSNPSIHDIMMNNEKNDNLSQLNQIVNASTNATFLNLNEDLPVSPNDYSIYFGPTTNFLQEFNRDDEEPRNDLLIIEEIHPNGRSLNHFEGKQGQITPRT